VTSPREVAILSAGPILSAALQSFLERMVPGICCRIVTSEASAASDDASPLSPRLPDDTPFGPGQGVVLFTAGAWEEMVWGLGRLSAQFPDAPWLLLADPRVAGTFLSLLHCRPCALVPPSASPEILPDALFALAHGHTLPLSFEMTARFARGAAVATGGRPIRLPTQAELQCGCAVSLGLPNRQIADLLCLGEATVKTHIHHLLQKLDLRGRAELAAFVQEALAPLPQSLGRR
jgi:DNA-binding NarL/FixJ family response regulator